MSTVPPEGSSDEPINYEELVGAFNQALLHTLRKHSIADSILDFWVPDADPLLGIVGMLDSARIAGRSSLIIRFTKDTIPEGRLAELKQAASRFARISLERRADHVLLHVADMKQDVEDGASSSVASRQRYWTAAEGRAAPEHAAVGPRWASAELPEFSDAHPRLRLALKGVAGNLRREGQGAELTGLANVTGREGEAWLSLDVDPQSHRVRQARHGGAGTPAAKAALDLFCLAAEGLPLQEVSDHVGLKVLDSLATREADRPVEGVLLPANAGMPFEIGPRLARRAYAEYLQSSGLKAQPNFYSATPSAEWQSMPAAERCARIEAGIRGFLQSAECYPDDMILLRLEKTRNGHETRAAIAFSERITVDRKPALLRRLEQSLRRDVERELELVAERARDSSPLRRLS